MKKEFWEREKNCKEDFINLLLNNVTYKNELSKRDYLRGFDYIEKIYEEAFNTLNKQKKCRKFLLKNKSCPNSFPFAEIKSDGHIICRASNLHPWKSVKGEGHGCPYACKTEWWGCKEKNSNKKCMYYKSSGIPSCYRSIKYIHDCLNNKNNCPVKTKNYYKSKELNSNNPLRTFEYLQRFEKKMYPNYI